MDTDIFWLILLLLAGGYWLYGERRHRQARLAALKICQEAKVQWLDQAVVLVNRSVRWPRGKPLPIWVWIFTFDYSVEGHERHVGEVVIHSQQVQWVSLGDTIIQESVH